MLVEPQVRPRNRPAFGVAALIGELHEREHVVQERPLSRTVHEGEGVHGERQDDEPADERDAVADDLPEGPRPRTSSRTRRPRSNATAAIASTNVR